jgi:hypothetical protein
VSACCKTKSFTAYLSELLQVATEMSEIHLLRVASKKLGAIIQILDAAQQHGFESEGFKTAHDLVSTSLSLEPVVNLALPRHVVYARHAMDIRGTESIERFSLLVSSSELQSHGVQCLALEQANGHTLRRERCVFEVFVLGRPGREVAVWAQELPDTAGKLLDQVQDFPGWVQAGSSRPTCLGDPGPARELPDPVRDLPGQVLVSLTIAG